MLLLFHITVALLSVFLGTFTFFKPSKLKLKTNYFLIAMTLLSGSILIIQNPSTLLQTCLTGITYVGIVTVQTLLANFRLASAKAEVES
jgi:hypothetical protein